MATIICLECSAEVEEGESLNGYCPKCVDKYERKEKRNMKQFSHSDIRKLDGCDTSTPFWFECAMISACGPVFSKCEDNHDVEDVLRKKGVITAKNQTDSECCALVVNFSTRKAGEAFIDRLNKYIAEKWDDKS